MTLNNSKNKFYSYLIILFSLFILVFWAKNIYYTLQESLDSNKMYSDKKIALENELNEYTNIENKITANEWNIKWDIDKFWISFSERKLLKYFYDYVENNYSLDNEIKIKSISFVEAWESDFWFKEWNVNASMYFWNEEILTEFLSFVISKKSKYTFFLDNFSYAGFANNKSEEEKKGINMTLNLKIYYK